MMGLNLVWVLALLIVFVALVVWFVRVMSPDDHNAPKSAEDDALEIARQRYACGEITAEEFSRLKQDLT